MCHHSCKGGITYATKFKQNQIYYTSLLLYHVCLDEKVKVQQMNIGHPLLTMHPLMHENLIVFAIVVVLSTNCTSIMPTIQ
jgi:hypothetical protein